MNFKEYNSSQITPQMTLLKKFNALIKWNLENSSDIVNKMYIHSLTFDSSGGPVSAVIFSLRKSKYININDIINDNFIISRVGNLLYETDKATGAYYYSSKIYIDGDKIHSMVITFGMSSFTSAFDKNLTGIIYDGVEEVTFNG